MAITIKENCSLIGHNTFKIDVKATQFINYENIDELLKVLDDLRKSNKRIMHIGCGSNLLFLNDFDGAILHSGIKDINYISHDQHEIVVKVGAGVIWDNFCHEMAHNNYYGCENLSHIPGEVGAAAVQNIGAYGVEVESIIREVETIEIATGKPRVFSRAECEYGYRDSIFKNKLKGQYIVTAVTFTLSTTPVAHLDYGQLQELKTLPTTPSAMEIRNAVINIRKSKLPEPDELGSAGSFFKNPVVDIDVFRNIAKNYNNVPHYMLNDYQVKIPAAWLIDMCGMKGKSMGGAAVYDKQPLIIVNKNHATPAHIAALASLIQQNVYKKFNIHIEPEVNYIY